LIFGGLVLFFYKDKIIAYGKTNASRQPAIAAGPGAASGRRGGDLTTPVRRYLANGDPNPATSSGGYTKHKSRKSTNKNRKANKTKKPRRTLQKNKKSKRNSSQKNKNKKTKTKKHRHTIRRK
jgi:hypothetical protein